MIGMSLLGIWRDVTWPDNWTAVTTVSYSRHNMHASHVHVHVHVQDGKRSAQFEHTLLVVEGGCEILTLRTETDGKPHFMTS